MRNLNAADMLNVWEQGLNRSLLQRTLILLVAAFPEMGPDTIAELSIGSRDGYLLTVRERLFGSRLVNNAVCPKCTGRIEWEQEISELVVENAGHHPAEQRNRLEIDDYRLDFRLPNSVDMAGLEGSSSAAVALKQLLKRCILSAEHAGTNCDIDQLPEPVIQALNQRIEELDPQAEIRINLTCPDCSHRWEVFFDIAGFLGAEINDWAERTIHSVHKLARAYGWTEQEILNLSPVRRQLYLGMVGQ
ncbi:MAG: T4 family baseplate hub assembly chaperone [Methylobacter sp.]